MEANNFSHFQSFLSNLKELTTNLGLNLPQSLDLNPLYKLPSGTFGRELADFFLSHEIQPFVIGFRRGILHDSLHVLTGYETDLLSEAEVQAFLFGTCHHPFHLFLGLGIVRRISRRQLYPTEPIYYRLEQAYRKGENSSFNIDTWHPENQWHLPLESVRCLYNLN